MFTVGEILQKQRIKKGLTLLDIEKKTKIREKYLKAIEKDNWDLFSSKVYIIGIIKHYSRILGLNEEKILAIFRRDYEKKEEIKFKKRVSESYFTPEVRKIIRKVFFILIIFFIFYFFYQLKLYFSPPKLTIISPKKFNFFKEDQVRIIGKTDKETMITIAGQRIYQNKEGIFEYDYPLQDGENKLIIELIGANGRKTKKEIVFKKLAR